MPKQVGEIHKIKKNKELNLTYCEVPVDGLLRTNDKNRVIITRYELFTHPQLIF